MDKPISGRIYIIGSLMLQNELMVKFIENEINYSCTHFPNTKIANIPSAKNHEIILFLLDCIKNDLDDFLIKPCIDYISSIPMARIALFNLKQKKGIEYKAIKRNIKGVFYAEDSLETIKKGIQVIMKGELWFSRRVMQRMLSDEIKNNEKYRESKNVLTHREKEILAMIAAGVANEDIAKKLFISPNTVKTHIYNIYRKISVPNRVQATLWAAKNL